MRSKAELDTAYAFCLKMAKSHYENFPVASILLPQRLRKPVAAIYAFSRTADDFADENALSSAERLRLLDNYSQHLTEISRQQYQGSDPIFIALHDSIQRFQLPTQLFDDLLTAFKQDVVKSRYTTFAELLDYCRYSANPVGRLLLYLQGKPTAQQLKQSDAICTALQLINFYQDIVQDYTEQDRIYLPQQELATIQFEEADLLRIDTSKLAPVLRNLYQRTEQIMNDGVELGLTVPGRLGWEIRAITLGGIATLSALKQQADSALLSRPRLSRQLLAGILLRSAQKKQYRQTIYKFS